MRDEQEHMRRVAEHLATIPVLSPAWATASREERLGGLQRLEDGVAALDRRAPATVAVVSGESPAFLSAYRRRDHRIFIAEAVFEEASPRGALQAALHAGRYAWQYALVEDPSRHGEVDPRLLAGLLQNWDRYVFPAPNLEGRYDRVFFRRP